MYRTGKIRREFVSEFGMTKLFFKRNFVKGEDNDPFPVFFFTSVAHLGFHNVKMDVNTSIISHVNLLSPNQKKEEKNQIQGLLKLR